MIKNGIPTHARDLDFAELPSQPLLAKSYSICPILRLATVVETTVVAATIVAAHLLLWLAKTTKLLRCPLIRAGHLNAVFMKTLHKWLSLLLKLAATLHQEENILYELFLEEATCALIESRMNKINSSINIADADGTPEQS